MARDILQRACAELGWRSTAVDYDLLLLDWRMPGMDGIEMLRQAYATPDLGLPLVVLMASTFELGAAAAAGDDLYLDAVVAKPMMPASLFEAVRGAHAGHFTPGLSAPQKPDRRLAGLRMLVAEDNELNQFVIEQMLERPGVARRPRQVAQGRYVGASGQAHRHRRSARHCGSAAELARTRARARDSGCRGRPENHWRRPGPVPVAVAQVHRHSPGRRRGCEPPCQCPVPRTAAAPQNAFTA